MAKPLTGLDPPCPGAMVGAGEAAVGGDGGGETPPTENKRRCNVMRNSIFIVLRDKFS